MGALEILFIIIIIIIIKTPSYLPAYSSCPVVCVLVEAGEIGVNQPTADPV